jgi:3-oxoacyl-(acyl-carrier-protein) synthase
MNREELFRSALAGDQRGIRRERVGDRTFLAGRVAADLPEPACGADLDPAEYARNTRLIRLADFALEQIRGPAEYFQNRYGPDRIGVCAGSCDNGSEGALRAHTAYFSAKAFPADYALRFQSAGYLAGFAARKFGARGPAITVSTACASSAGAVAKAGELIRAGLCDAVIAGGADVASQTVLLGFGALEAVSQTISNPFSKNRNGITLGEAAAFFVLSKDFFPFSAKDFFSKKKKDFPPLENFSAEKYFSEKDFFLKEEKEFLSLNKENFEEKDFLSSEKKFQEKEKLFLEKLEKLEKKEKYFAGKDGRRERKIVLLGAGESADAYHITAPRPDGNGAVMAMKRSLERAGVSAWDVDYLNLHGTGTPLNDGMEARAVAEVFPDYAERPAASSTKPITGHTLGAAGALELALCWMVLAGGGGLPMHCWDGVRDEALPALRFADAQTRLENPSVCMSNSFAFGGCNVSLVLGVSS